MSAPEAGLEARESAPPPLSTGWGAIFIHIGGPQDTPVKNQSPSLISNNSLDRHAAGQWEDVATDNHRPLRPGNSVTLPFPSFKQVTFP